MKHLTFDKQILIVLLTSIGFTILFSFYFIHFLYSEIYLNKVEESIVNQGKQTAAHYHYGELSDEIIQRIQWYNIISEYTIIVVDHLEDLTTYFPYQINYENLIDKKDEHSLEQGQYVLKEGYVEEFDREVLGAIFPIKGEHQLLGFIYIYVPLEAIQDIFKESIPLLLAVGVLFFLILFFVIHRIWQSIYRPIKNLQRAAKEVSKGNYGEQLIVESDNEIGQLTAAFNQMSQSLAQLELLKKEFTSNITHELRTPLTYISGYTNALKQKLYDSPDEAEHYIDTIQKETNRINKLINDLLYLNHLQDGLFTIEKQPIVLSELLFNTIDLFDIHRKEKQLKLSLNISEDIIIFGDDKRIHQVFYNTIDNAIKYSNNSETITIDLFQKGQVAFYQINNIGTAIDEKDINRISERFFRTDQARTRTTGGTGLGLSIVKEIVRLHAGQLTIESDPISGTTIIIQLPLIE